MAKERNVTIVLKARDEASRVIEGISKNALPQFAKRIAQLTTAGLSVGALEETLRRSVAAAIEAEKATAGLTAALAAQGIPTAALVPKLVAQAEALSKVSLASDEAIQGAQKVLITVGGLLGPKLDETTKAALDLSAGLGIDLAQAAEMLAKAANGSVRAFTQLGVNFAANATDAQKLDTALAFVQSRFGGMAAHELTTADGATKQLSKSFGELEESLGKVLISTTGAVGGMQSLTSIMEQLNEQANNKNAQGFWTSLAVLFAGAAGSGASGGLGALNVALAEVAANTALAEKETKQLSDAIDEANLENPMIGFSDATQVARDKLKAAEAAAAAVARATEDAKKSAEGYSKAIAAFKDRTEVQTFDPVQRKPKEPVTGASSDAVLKRLVDDAEASVDPLVSSLKNLGVTIDSELIAKARLAEAAMRALDEAFVAGRVSPERFEVLSAEIEKVSKELQQAGIDVNLFADGVDLVGKKSGVLAVHASEWEKVLSAIERAHGGLIRLDEQIAVVAKDTNEWALVIEDALNQGATSAAQQLGDTLVDAAFGAKVEWEETLDSILKGLIKVVAQALIAKAITTALGASGGGSVPAAGGATWMAGGGVAPPADTLVYAAKGHPGGPKGTDTVPAWLTPGEIVLPRAVAQRLLKGDIAISGPRTADGRRGATDLFGGRLSVVPTLTALAAAAEHASTGLIVPRGVDFGPAMPMPARVDFSTEIARSRQAAPVTGQISAGAARPSSGEFSASAAASRQSSQGGRPIVLNVNAMDARSFEDFLTQNPRALVAALDYLEDRGYR